MFLVDIVQHMWHTREIPQDLGWTVLVPLPKGTIYTQGVGLMETLCKVLEELVDTRLRASLQLHEVLHRFHSRRGIGEAIMDLKLTQELVI